MSFRLDRFLTLRFFGLLAKRFPCKKGIYLPILMYHSICDERETGHPYFWINTPPARFAEHMQFLHDNGYTVISLCTAVQMIHGFSLNTNHQPLNTKSVVLTFDDGFKDFYTHAFPVLKKHGFTATVFLPTDYIDGETPGLRGKQHLTWEQVRDLAAQGISFGSHTCSHPQLYDLTREEIEVELRESKETIEAHLSESTSQPVNQSTGFDSPVNVDSFCYPYKFPEQDQKFLRGLGEILQSRGYYCCLSTRIGTVNTVADLLSLRRTPINAGDDLPLFRAKLEGAYDWIQSFQAAAKRTRRARSGSISLPKSPVTNQRIN